VGLAAGRGRRSGSTAATSCNMQTLGGTRDTDGVGRRVSCPDFVGRAEELRILTAAIDAAVAGTAATVLVGGDAGIGKTRFVGEVSARARDRGAVVATGACLPMEGGGLPYGPVMAIIGHLVRQFEGSITADSLGSLASGFGVGGPALAEPVASYSAKPHLADELGKTKLFGSILTAFAEIAEQVPLVLVLEDLQWADSGSTELLAFLTRNLLDARVLLIATYRSDDVSRTHPLRTLISELARHPQATTVALPPLERAEVADLVSGIIGADPAPALVDSIWERSQGNAFFAEELTLARDDPDLSTELRDVIMSGLEVLSADAQRLLRVAAVIGSDIDHELLVAVGVLDAAAVDEAVAELVERQMLVVDAHAAGYRFRHELLREAIDDAQLPFERRRLHLAVADALSRDPALGPTDPIRRSSELARHCWAAGVWAGALTSSLAAADATYAVWAFPETLAHLERALGALDQLDVGDVPPEVDRGRVLEQAADVAYFTKHVQRCVDLARECIDATDPSDAATLARRWALLGRNFWALGDSEGAFEAYRQAVAIVPPEPSVVLARVMAEEARGYMLLARHIEAVRRADDAIAVAREMGAASEECHARYTNGVSRASLGFYDEGIAQVREALAMAEEIGSVDDANRAYMGLSSLLAESGRLEESVALVFDSAAIGEELWGARLNGAAGNCVWTLIQLGRLDEAESLLALTGQQGVGSCMSSPSMLAAEIAMRRGDLEEALRHLAVSDGLTASLDDVQLRGAYHLLEAEVALLQERPRDGYEHIEQALAIAVTTDDASYRPEMYMFGIRALADEVEAARASGGRVDVQKAQLLADGMVEDCDEVLAGVMLRGGSPPPRSVAFQATCLAEASRLHERGPASWQSAAALWEAAGEPHPVAYCHWREAEALLAGRSGRARAEQLLQQAWVSSVTIGSEPLTRSIESLARRARVDLSSDGQVAAPPGSSVGDDLGLTPREVEVLGQLAAGRRDAEISDALFISKKTASVHVSNILRKLDVANRVEAGKIGQAYGLG
jgi:DNA-binding CsgD family transcriptional regulator/tetratricopeptide (TPR) repeat protein